MGNISTIGLDDLITDLSALAELPDSVIDAMLTAQADIIEPEQKRVMKTMWAGKYQTGKTAASVKRTKIKGGRDGRNLSIYPQGTNSDGNRNAEVAFVNEFGAHGGKQPARPAIETAIKNKAEQTFDAAEKEYNAFVDSRNL